MEGGEGFCGKRRATRTNFFSVIYHDESVSFEIVL